MRLILVCVGKLKQAYWRDAAAEYIKRLSRFARVEVQEVSDEPAPRQLSDAEVRALMDREGQRICARLRPDDFVVTMEVAGRRYESRAFARALSGWMQSRRLVFVVGGSHGLSEAVCARADAKLSLSDMTLPHQLARVVLLEQIYRAFKINGNETYHK